MARNIVLHSADELSLWAEDEGLLDDTVLLGVDPAERTITFGLRVLEAPTGRFLSFTMSGDETAIIAVRGAPRLPAPMTCLRAEEGKAFGLDVASGRARIRALARTWRVKCGREIELPVARPTSRRGRSASS